MTSISGDILLSGQNSWMCAAALGRLSACATTRSINRFDLTPTNLVWMGGGCSKPESLFLDQGTVIAGGEDMTVVGGGPTAAWCVQRALAVSCNVLWISNERMNPAFVSSLRNDDLAQGPLNRHRKLRNSVVAQSVFPAHPGLRFVEGYQIDRIDPHPAGVEIKLLPVPKKTQRHVDQTPDPLPPALIRIHFKPILSEI
jgi:hypothetical protein